MEQRKKKVKESTPLHPCSELPSKYSTAENDCLNDLVNHYNVVGYLAYGLYGITMEIKRYEHQLAVKIFEKNKGGISEIKIACKLNDLKDLTSIFTYIHGWVLCKGIPEDWDKRIPWNKIDDYNYIKKSRTDKNFGLLYLVMDKISYSFSKVPLSEDDLIKILFILLHGLFMTRTKYPYFRHTDIHVGNVMIDEKPMRDLKLAFPLLSSTVVIKDVRYFPKLIDFGLSNFEDWDKKDIDDLKRWNNSFSNGSLNFEKQHDIFRIFDIISYEFKHNFPRSQKTKDLEDIMESGFLKDFMNLYTHDNDKFLKTFPWLLLSDEQIFKDIISIEKGEINTQICTHCKLDNATMRYDHSEDYLFCSKECADVYDVFKNYFPVK
jgi:hypothetical protein